MKTTLWSTATLLAVTALSAPPVQAQQPELPLEVRQWLERDQARRWAMMISEGDSLFNSGSCARCHGPEGTGGRNGPDLADGTWVQGDGTLEEIRRTIFWGVRRELFSNPSWRFEMNPAGGLSLTWEQYASLAAYVWSLSNDTGLPG